LAIYEGVSELSKIWLTGCFVQVAVGALIIPLLESQDVVTDDPIRGIFRAIVLVPLAQKE